MREPFDLRAWRLRMELTQQEAAAMLYMTPRHYRRIEAKPVMVTRATVRLCKFLEQEKQNGRD